jgi:hypothetical protein
VKGFWEYIRLKNVPSVHEDIFIGQSLELMQPDPGTSVADSDLTPKEKQNKFKKKPVKK